MIRRSGATGHGQFDQRSTGGYPDVIGVHPRPDRIQRCQPLEKRGVLGNSSGQRLIEVVVGVDQSGNDDLVGEIEDLIGGGRKTCRRADLFDPSITGEEATAGDLLSLLVHRHQHRGIAGQEGCH